MKKNRTNKHLEFLQEETTANVSGANYNYPGVGDIVNWRGQGGIPYALKHDDLDEIAKKIAGEDGIKGAATKVSNTNEATEDEDDSYLFEYGDVEDTEYISEEAMDDEDDEEGGIGIKVKDADAGEDVEIDVPTADEEVPDLDEEEAAAEEEAEEEEEEVGDEELEDLDDENEEELEAEEAEESPEFEAGEEEEEEGEEEEEEGLEDEEKALADSYDFSDDVSPLSLLEGTDESEALERLLTEMGVTAESVSDEDAFLDQLVEEVVVGDNSDDAGNDEMEVSQDKVAESSEDVYGDIITEAFYGKL